LAIYGQIIRTREDFKEVMRHMFRPRLILILGLALLSLSMASCGAMMSKAAKPMIDDLSMAVMKQNDPQLVRDGAPAYLLLIDGIIEGQPDNPDLLLAGAQLYGAYNSAFVGSKDKNARLFYRRKPGITPSAPFPSATKFSPMSGTSPSNSSKPACPPSRKRMRRLFSRSSAAGRHGFRSAPTIGTPWPI